MHTQLCEALLETLVFNLELQESVEPREGIQTQHLAEYDYPVTLMTYMVTLRLGNGFATAKKQREVDSLSI